MPTKGHVYLGILLCFLLSPIFSSNVSFKTDHWSCPSGKTTEGKHGSCPFTGHFAWSLHRTCGLHLMSLNTCWHSLASSSSALPARLLMRPCSVFLRSHAFACLDCLTGASAEDHHANKCSSTLEFSQAELSNRMLHPKYRFKEWCLTPIWRHAVSLPPESRFHNYNCNQPPSIVFIPF